MKSRLSASAKISTTTPTMAHIPPALTQTNFPGLKLISSGKVRDIYETSSPDHLLFVATDRISAYDVILRNGIPLKGALLTTVSAFWFNKLRDVIPNHVVTTNIDEMPQEIHKYKNRLEGRVMLVRKARVVKIEAIVRGYLSGSGWSEYKKSGTVHGTPLPPGFVESDKLPQPLFTPSTKADQGEHDENISPARAAEIIGADLCEQISATAIKLYTLASEFAATRGVLLADTKFEFGLVPDPDDPTKEMLILVDELLTPDSSRYWPLASYAPGKSQPSFDKQFLRDWLVGAGFKKGLEAGPETDPNGGWVIPPEIIEGTRKRYVEVVSLLMGESNSDS